MGIGAYRQLVILESQDGQALDAAAWPCAISQVGAVAEGLAAYVVVGRYHPAINLETRLMFEGRTLQVQTVDDVDERHETLRIQAVEARGRV